MGKNKKPLPARKSVLDPLQVFLHAAYFEYSSCMLGQLALARIHAAATASQQTVLHPGGIVEATTKLADGIPPTYIPTGVNSIFSVELFLKSLLIQEKGGTLPNKVHTLSELFAELSHPARTRIEQLFKVAFEKDGVGPHLRDASSNPSEWELEPLLEKHNRVFQDVRYSYELEEDWEFNTLVPIRNALREYAFEVNPTWRTELEKLGPLPTLLYR